jgi:hypothetical protein
VESADIESPNLSKMWVVREGMRGGRTLRRRIVSISQVNLG